MAPSTIKVLWLLVVTVGARASKANADNKFNKGSVLRTMYLGCYDDAYGSAATRDLPNFVGVGSVSQCAAKCEGFKYFRHQSTLECWCGSKVGGFGKSKDCVCDDPVDLGSGVNCVYQIQKVSVDPAKAKLVQKLKGSTKAKLEKLVAEGKTANKTIVQETKEDASDERGFIGCFEDLMDGSRDLPTFAGIGSLAQCADMCRDYEYFGRQSLSECRCGNAYGKFGWTTGCMCDDPEDIGAGVNCVYDRRKAQRAGAASGYAERVSAPAVVRMLDEGEGDEREREESLDEVDPDAPHGVCGFFGAATFHAGEGREIMAHFYEGKQKLKPAMAAAIRDSVTAPAKARFDVISVVYNGTGVRVAPKERDGSHLMRFDFIAQYPCNGPTTTTTTTSTSTWISTSTTTTTLPNITTNTTTTTTSTTTTTTNENETNGTEENEETTTTTARVTTTGGDTSTTGIFRRLRAGPGVPQLSIAAVASFVPMDSILALRASPARRLQTDASFQEQVMALKDELKSNLPGKFQENLMGETGNTRVWGVTLLNIEGFMSPSWQSVTSPPKFQSPDPNEDDKGKTDAAMAGYASAIVVGCCACSCLCIYLWSSRTRAVGVHKLPLISKGAYAVFRVKQVPSEKNTKSTHVIWDLSHCQLDTYFASTGGQKFAGVAEWDDFGMATKGEDPASPPTLKEEGSEGNFPPSSADNELPVTMATVIPIFSRGKLVEYYSPTWKVWVQGTISVNTTGTPAEPRVTYDVVASVGRRKQLRRNVPLNAVRRTMTTGENVEIYSPKDGVWTKGVIVDDPQIRLALGGYKVKHSNGEEISVPRHLTRRCYDHDEKVRVYQGPRIGWVTGTVDKTAAEGAMDEAFNAGLVPHAQTFDFDAAGDPGDLLAAEMQADSANNDALPWAMVPVRGIDGDVCKVIPSYLLFPQSVDEEAPKPIPMVTPPKKPEVKQPKAAPIASIDITFKDASGLEQVVTFTAKFLGFRYRKSQPVVTEVVAGSEAEKVGVRPDMEIVSIGGQNVAGKSFKEVEAMMSEGLAVINEDGKEDNAASPPGFDVAFSAADGSVGRTYKIRSKYIGFEFAEAETIVTSVSPNSHAAMNGITEGMKVVAVSGHSIAGMTYEQIEEDIRSNVAALPSEE